MHQRRRGASVERRCTYPTFPLSCYYPGTLDGRRTLRPSMSKETLPSVEVQPAGFTPKYGWPFVSRNRRSPRSRPSRRTNLVAGACLVAALGFVIYFIVELISHI